MVPEEIVFGDDQCLCMRAYVGIEGWTLIHNKRRNILTQLVRVTRTPHTLSLTARTNDNVVTIGIARITRSSVPSTVSDPVTLCVERLQKKDVLKKT